MIGHEIAGIFALVFTGVIIISALSKNAATSTVLDSTFNGTSSVIKAMTGPVSGSGSAQG